MYYFRIVIKLYLSLRQKNNSEVKNRMLNFDSKYKREFENNCPYSPIPFIFFSGSYFTFLFVITTQCCMEFPPHTTPKVYYLFAFLLLYKYSIQFNPSFN